MKNKKWSVRYATEDGFKYESIIGLNVLKVIEYVCKERGVDPTAIDYLNAEECVVIE